MSVIPLSPDCLLAATVNQAGGHDLKCIMIQLRVPPVSLLKTGDDGIRLPIDASEPLRPVGHTEVPANQNPEAGALVLLHR